MKFKEYINESLKFKKVKNINGLIKYEIIGFDWWIEQQPSRFKTDSKGKPKDIWKIFIKDKGPITSEYSKLSKAKKIVNDMIKRMEKK